jgi:Na+-driven multidrug efflux pump
MPPQTDPVAQAKTLKFVAMNMVVAGLIVGIGVPVLFVVLGIQVEMTPWGVDVIWLVLWVVMIFDFVLARMFWRRASALEQGPPR